MEEQEILKEMIESLEILYKATGDTLASLKETQKELVETKLPTILYICDRKQCKNCKDYCTHTTDITHAENFKCLDDGTYAEEEPTTGSFEMKLDPEQFESIQKALKIAIEKPLESEWPYKEVNRAAKKGEYIKIVNNHPNNTQYNNGDIFKVKRMFKLSNDGVVIELVDGGRRMVWNKEYVVLEGYKPPKKKKK